MKPPQLAKIHVSKADKVPPHWYNRRQLQKEWGLSTAQTNSLISNAIQAGKAKVKKFKIHGVSGSLYCVPHYNFK